MSRRALDEIASIGALRAAWNEINRRSRGASRQSSGIDNESIEQVASNSERTLISIRRHVLSAPAFAFSPLRAHFIPKSDGKDRVICVPTVRDRILQRSISNYLARYDRCRLANGVSYGFIRGRGVRAAIQKACKLRRIYPWVYKTDITAFFDRIPRDSLKAEIRSKVRASTLHELLAGAVDTEIQESSTERRKRLSRMGIREGVGVRQGMPLSPFFANLVLRDFDATIEGMGIEMVRYADDLAIFRTSNDECHEAHSICESLLDAKGFSIPEPSGEGKTRIVTPQEPVELLGVGIKRSGRRRYQPFVLSKQLETIRSRILAISSIQEARARGLKMAQLLQRLQDTIAGYDQAYQHCANRDQVLTVCSEARREVIRRIFLELGVEVESLNREDAVFLGIDEK